MKHLDEVALIIESAGYLENCYTIKCDRKAVSELLVEYRDEIVEASLKEIYSREFGEKDDELLAAIRCVLNYYMIPDEYAEWMNEIEKEKEREL